MSRKTALLASVAALAMACEPEVGERANPSVIDLGLFDLTVPAIPTPNDLQLLLVPGTLPPGPAGGPPGTPGATVVQVLFQRLAPLQPGGPQVPASPPLDLSTINFANPVASSVVVVGPNALPVTDIQAAQAPSSVPVPLTALLIFKPTGTWLPGRHTVLVRAGQSGLRTDEGPVAPAPTMFFLTGEGSLVDPTRPSPVPGASPAQLAQLEALRTQAIRPAVDALIAAGLIESAEDVASIQTFTIAP